MFRTISMADPEIIVRVSITGELFTCKSCGRLIYEVRKRTQPRRHHPVVLQGETFVAMGCVDC